MKYNLITFGLGLALGLFFSFMYRTLIVDVYVPPINKMETKALEKGIAKSEVSYTKTFDSLKKQGVKLGMELNDTKTALQKAKQKSYSLQVEVYELMDKHFEKKQKDEAPDNSCDSLISTVEILMQSSTEKDSLYENVTSNLEDQLQNKDSTLAIKDKQYVEIKSAFTKSIEGQKELIDQNKFLQKEAKRQKFKSKILSAALFIFTGVATNYLIQH